MHTGTTQLNIHLAVVTACSPLSKELLLAFLKNRQYEKKSQFLFFSLWSLPEKPLCKMFFSYVFLGNNESCIKYKNYLLENKTIKRCFTTGAVWKLVPLGVWDTLNLSVSKKVSL